MEPYISFFLEKVVLGFPGLIFMSAWFGFAQLRPKHEKLGLRLSWTGLLLLVGYIIFALCRWGSELVMLSTFISLIAFVVALLVYVLTVSRFGKYVDPCGPYDYGIRGSKTWNYYCLASFCPDFFPGIVHPGSYLHQRRSVISDSLNYFFLRKLTRLRNFLSHRSRAT